MAKKKKPSRCEMRKHLERQGHNFNRDYYMLAATDRSEIFAAAQKAGYSQGASSKASGRSRGYAYYLSLQNAKCKPTGLSGMLAGIFGKK
jgi:hypothetical protein